MSRHLKPEEFMSLMEGGTLEAKRAAHAEACEQCTRTLKAIESVGVRMIDLEEEPVEPEWSDFRASVRDTLLSRAVLREASSRRWLGWTRWLTQPQAAWALSIVLVAGLTITVLRWDAGTPDAAQTAEDSISMSIPSSDPSTLRTIVAAEGMVWSNVDVFDEIAALGPEESKQFQQLLESEAQRSRSVVGQ